MGGVVGYANAASVSNCYSTGVSVSGAGNNVGGVAGAVWRSGSLSVSNCYSAAEVVGAGDYVGGVVGEVYQAMTSNYAASVENCRFTGNATGGQYVGGVVGRV